mgnify:CR=1 FL=1
MAEENYEDIWEIVSKAFPSLTREEFDKLVDDVYQKAKSFLTRRAAAMIVARNLGVDTSQIAYPPIIGRLLEVGPVKMSKGREGETPYVLFSIVNTEERIPCVAFGDHHIRLLKESDDKVLRLRKYLKVKLRKYTLVKVTENSIIEILDDNLLPPITELKPAWAESLKEMKQQGGTYLVKVLVIDETILDREVCPICGRPLEFREEGYYCPEHGQVEPERKKYWRFIISDSSGTFPAISFVDPPVPSVLDRLVVLKGYFKGDELQIKKFYWVSEEEIV